jgi:hypothetical protein
VFDDGDVFYGRWRMSKVSKSPEMTVGRLLKDAQVTWKEVFGRNDKMYDLNLVGEPISGWIAEILV